MGYAVSYVETKNIRQKCEKKKGWDGANLWPQKIGRKTVGMPSEGNAKAETRVGNTFRRLQKLHNMQGRGKGSFLAHTPHPAPPPPPRKFSAPLRGVEMKMSRSGEVVKSCSLGCVIKAVHPFNPCPQKERKFLK